MGQLPKIAITSGTLTHRVAQALASARANGYFREGTQPKAREVAEDMVSFDAGLEDEDVGKVEGILVELGLRK